MSQTITTELLRKRPLLNYLSLIPFLCHSQFLDQKKKKKEKRYQQGQAATVFFMEIQPK